MDSIKSIIKLKLIEHIRYVEDDELIEKHYVDEDNNVWDMNHKIIIGKRTVGICGVIGGKICLGECLEECYNDGYHCEKNGHLCDLYPCKNCNQYLPYWLATCKEDACASCNFQNYCVGTEDDLVFDFQTEQTCDMCGIKFNHDIHSRFDWDFSLLCGHIFCETCISSFYNLKRNEKLEKRGDRNEENQDIVERQEIVMEYTCEKDDVNGTYRNCNYNYKRNELLHIPCEQCKPQTYDKNENQNEEIEEEQNGPYYLSRDKLSKCPIKYCVSSFLLFLNHHYKYVSIHQEDYIGWLREILWDPMFEYMVKTKGTYYQKEKYFQFELHPLFRHDFQIKEIKETGLWNKEVHKYLNDDTKMEIWELLKIWTIHKQNVHNLPKDVLYLIFTYLSKYHKQCAKCKKDDKFLDDDDYENVPENLMNEYKKILA